VSLSHSPSPDRNRPSGKRPRRQPHRIASAAEPPKSLAQKFGDGDRSRVVDPTPVPETQGGVDRGHPRHFIRWQPRTITTAGGPDLDGADLAGARCGVRTRTQLVGVAVVDQDLESAPWARTTPGTRQPGRLGVPPLAPQKHPLAHIRGHALHDTLLEGASRTCES